MKLTIGHLYGDLMNMYGDLGNIITLKKRAQWRGIDVEIVNVSVGDKLKTGEIDIFFFGGGQDQAQEVVAKDLQIKATILKSEAERGVPILAICGGYQLLGEYYLPHQGPKLPGISIFPAYTVASYDRMIGNIVVKPNSNVILGSEVTPESTHFLVGFENHSGKTYLKPGAKPLGHVIKGFGNNGSDKTEGCIYRNSIGCYMHGSLLPKNPHLADWLIKKALEIKYSKEIILKPLDDTLENTAHQKAISRFG